jgi:hypothetical protein
MQPPNKSERAFARALLALPEPERSRAFVQLCDNLDESLPPPERLTALYRRKRREHFISWMRTLDVRQCADVHRRLVTGEDLGAITADYPTAPRPAPRGAGDPREGQDDHTSRNRRPPAR